MKSLFLFAFFISSLSAGAQTLRYFEFTTGCGHGNWQDTSFIVAASDPLLIAGFMAELEEPEGFRKFINGPIAGGNPGYNANASHLFKWHFIPDQWSLVENAIEVCDGCPYSDVDQDTTGWVHTIGQFCPWTSQPSREVFPLTGVDPGENAPVMIYPNPAADQIRILTGADERLVEIFSTAGQQVLRAENYKGGFISVTALPPGLYIVKISGGKKVLNSKILISR